MRTMALKLQKLKSAHFLGSPKARRCHPYVIYYAQLSSYTIEYKKLISFSLVHLFRAMVSERLVNAARSASSGRVEADLFSSLPR